MELIDALNWRYATKRMNGERVPETAVNTVLEAIRLSPSSIGLQPYNVVVISDPQLREKVKAIANNQLQITEASHILVFAAWRKVTAERIDAFITNTAKVRNVTEDSLGGLRDYGNYFVGQTAEDNFNWAARQAYLAFGAAIIAAATLQVDATPMEGFDGPALDELLNLEAQGLKSVTILTLGYRDAKNDWLLPLKKVRTPKETLFISGEQLVEARD